MASSLLPSMRFDETEEIVAADPDVMSELGRRKASGTGLRSNPGHGYISKRSGFVGGQSWRRIGMSVRVARVAGEGSHERGAAQLAASTLSATVLEGSEERVSPGELPAHPVIVIGQALRRRLGDREAGSDCQRMSADLDRLASLAAHLLELEGGDSRDRETERAVAPRELDRRLADADYLSDVRRERRRVSSGLTTEDAVQRCLLLSVTLEKVRLINS
jgi:hypothetical protein